MAQEAPTEEKKENSPAPSIMSNIRETSGADFKPGEGEYSKWVSKNQTRSKVVKNSSPMESAATQKYSQVRPKQIHSASRQAMNRQYDRVKTQIERNVDGYEEESIIAQLERRIDELELELKGVKEEASLLEAQVADFEQSREAMKLLLFGKDIGEFSLG